MIYLKSFVAGLMSLVLLTPLFVIVVGFLTPPGSQYDLRAILEPPVPLAALCIFATGFYWEFRRASQQS